MRRGTEQEVDGSRYNLGTQHEESIEDWEACFDELVEHVAAARRRLLHIDLRMGDYDKSGPSRKDRGR